MDYFKNQVHQDETFRLLDFRRRVYSWMKKLESKASKPTPDVLSQPVRFDNIGRYMKKRVKQTRCLCFFS